MNSVFSNVTFFLLLANIFPAIFTYGFLKYLTHLLPCSESCKWSLHKIFQIDNAWNFIALIVVLSIIVPAIGMLIEWLLEKIGIFKFRSAPTDGPLFQR